MKTKLETILTVLPASSDDERVLVVLTSCPAIGSRVEFWQQSWGEGVGWFTQSKVLLEPDQVAQLRSALGNASPHIRNSSSALPRRFTRVSKAGFSPKVVRADSA